VPQERDGAVNSVGDASGAPNHMRTALLAAVVGGDRVDPECAPASARRQLPFTAGTIIRAASILRRTPNHLRLGLAVRTNNGGRGCVVFTATDPAGPWSDGLSISAVHGIDPDLAWDDDGAAYVTCAVLDQGILQVRVDLDSGQAMDSGRRIRRRVGVSPRSSVTAATPLAGYR